MVAEELALVNVSRAERNLGLCWYVRSEHYFVFVPNIKLHSRMIMKHKSFFIKTTSVL